MTDCVDHNDFVRVISGWFQRAEVAELKLPRGWFGGRKGEGYFALNWIEVRPHKLLLEPNEQVLLVFTDIHTVVANDRQLVLKDFVQLVVDGQGFGDMRPYTEVYREGEVVFEVVG
jgi:hypothetical protein